MEKLPTKKVKHVEHVGFFLLVIPRKWRVSNRHMFTQLCISGKKSCLVQFSSQGSPTDENPDKTRGFSQTPKFYVRRNLRRAVSTSVNFWKRFSTSTSNIRTKSLEHIFEGANQEVFLTHFNNSQGGCSSSKWVTLFTIVGAPYPSISSHIPSYGLLWRLLPQLSYSHPKSSKAGHLLRYFFIVSRFLRFFCSFQWISLREKLQESPMIFMGKSLWFPVNFPFNQSNQVCKVFHRFFFQRLQLEILFTRIVP